MGVDVSDDEIGEGQVLIDSGSPFADGKTVHADSAQAGQQRPDRRDGGVGITVLSSSHEGQKCSVVAAADEVDGPSKPDCLRRRPEI